MQLAFDQYSAVCVKFSSQLQVYEQYKNNHDDAGWRCCGLTFLTYDKPPCKKCKARDKTVDKLNKKITPLKEKINEARLKFFDTLFPVIDTSMLADLEGIVEKQKKIANELAEKKKKEEEDRKKKEEEEKLKAEEEASKKKEEEAPKKISLSKILHEIEVNEARRKQKENEFHERIKSTGTKSLNDIIPLLTPRVLSTLETIILTAKQAQPPSSSPP